jgi:hypothetical protein
VWLCRPELGNDHINEAAQLRRLSAIGMEEKMNGPSGGFVPGACRCLFHALIAFTLSSLEKTSSYLI